jgi:tetratricopeptide (TPR) repeat protein
MVNRGIKIVCLGWLLAAAVSAQTALAPDKPVESEMSATATDIYTIVLAGDQFLHLEAVQKWADVKLVLIGPDGQRVMDVDAAKAPDSPESLYFVADQAGEYKVEVSLGVKASAAGKYEIKIVDLRPASRDDLEQAAKFIGNQAVPLFGRDNVLARTLASRSLDLAGRAGARPIVASELGLIGNTYTMEGDLARAIDHHTRALTIWQELKDPRRALASNNLAIAYAQAGDREGARRSFEDSYRVMIDAGQKYQAAVMLYNVATMHREQGDLTNAIEYLLRSEALFKEAGARDTPPDLLINFAAFYKAKGDLDLAIAYYDRARLGFERSASKYGLYQTFDGLGGTHLLKGDLLAGISYLEKALEVERQMNSRLDMAATLKQIGDAYADLGKKEEAQQRYDEALKLALASNSPGAEADILTSQVRLSLRSGQTAEAIRLGEQARDRSRSGTGQYRSAELNTVLARAYLIVGRTEDAKKSLSSAIDNIEFRSAERNENANVLLDRSPYDLLTSILVNAKKDQDALYAAERVRSRLLINTIDRGRLNPLDDHGRASG